MCAYRDGSAACQKRREWGLIAGGDPRPFAFPKFSKPLSPGILRKHRLRSALLFLHWGPGLRHFGPHWGVFCQFRLDNLQWGPIVAFSAERFCRGFWRGFLLRASNQTSDWAFVECFGKGFLRGTSIGFPRAFCGGFHRAFRRGFHGAFAGILTGIPTGFREVQPTFRGKQTPTIDSLRNESRSTCSRFRVLNAAASCGKKGDD